MLIRCSEFAVVFPCPLRPAAWPAAALEDGAQEVNQFALRHALEPLEVGQDGDGLRFCTEGWMRLWALTAQREERFSVGKAYSQDELRAAMRLSKREI